MLEQLRRGEVMDGRSCPVLVVSIVGYRPRLHRDRRVGLCWILIEINSEES